jgi:drug/metabolite transporter (DMT)-like permease
MRKKECRFRTLIIPSLLILFGLILINVPYISMSSSITEFLFGIFCALVSLSAWSWYVVDNAHFLSQNPDLKSGDWATMIGVTTLVWVAIMSVVCSPAIEFSKFWTPGQPLLHFIIGSLILGSLCSWLGAYLWNIASLRIPVTLAGQMTIFESIFGLLFIYSINRHTPPPLECLGIAFLLGAILYGINSKKVPVLE